VNRAGIVPVINKYSFELAAILAELVAIGIVGLTLLALFGPLQPRARADGQIRVGTIPTGTSIQVRRSQIEPAEIYITVTELQAPHVTPSPDRISLDISRSEGFNAPTLPLSFPLRDWPVGGPVSQGFGCSPYYTGIPGLACDADRPWFHNGVDIVAGPGTPIQAGLAGTVIFAGPDGDGPPCGAYRGYGLGVVVDNGAGWQALYAHLSEITVATGQAVRPDTVIGTVGDTGCGTGPHLHFGLQYKGELVDPALFKP
jgi:murein DD-endopeptidase MepM/ murein hydrolase activator NlpD